MKLTIRRNGFCGCALNMNYSLMTHAGEMIAEGVCTSVRAVELTVATRPMTLRIWQKQARRIVEKSVDIHPNADAVIATIKISMMKLALIFPIIGLFKPTFSIDVALDYW